jgi:hypothetical protein
MRLLLLFIALLVVPYCLGDCTLDEPIADFINGGVCTLAALQRDSGSLLVSISPFQGWSLYYTVDGSIPTESSTFGEGTILALNMTDVGFATVNIKVNCSGVASATMASKTFLLGFKMTSNTDIDISENIYFDLSTYYLTLRYSFDVVISSETDGFLYVPSTGIPLQTATSVGDHVLNVRAFNITDTDCMEGDARSYNLNIKDLVVEPENPVLDYAQDTYFAFVGREAAMVYIRQNDTLPPDITPEYLYNEPYFMTYELGVDKKIIVTSVKNSMQGSVYSYIFHPGNCNVDCTDV